MLRRRKLMVYSNTDLAALRDITHEVVSLPMVISGYRPKNDPLYNSITSHLLIVGLTSWPLHNNDNNNNDTCNNK